MPTWNFASKSHFLGCFVGEAFHVATGERSKLPETTVTLGLRCPAVAGHALNTCPTGAQRGHTRAYAHWAGSPVIDPNTAQGRGGAGSQTMSLGC